MKTTATITSIEAQPRNTFFVTVTPEREQLSPINFDLSGFGVILRIMGNRVLVSGDPNVRVGDSIEAASVPNAAWQTGIFSNLPVLTPEEAKAIMDRFAANFAAFRSVLR